MHSPRVTNPTAECSQCHCIRKSKPKKSLQNFRGFFGNFCRLLHISAEIQGNFHKLLMIAEKIHLINKDIEFDHISHSNIAHNVRSIFKKFPYP